MFLCGAKGPVPTRMGVPEPGGVGPPRPTVKVKRPVRDLRSWDRGFFENVPAGADWSEGRAVWPTPLGGWAAGLTEGLGK